MVRSVQLASLVPLAGALTSGRSESISGANPVRKVVNLLQKMQAKVIEEGEKAEELHRKFQCYCKTSGGDLADSIAAAEKKIPEVVAQLEELASKKEQFEADLKSHQKDRSSAKAAVKEATALRQKEKAAFEKSKGDDDQNLAAVKKAVVAIESGMGSFLQTQNAEVVRKFVSQKQDMPDSDRREVLAFLSGGQTDGYAPASGEIVGILKTMADEMQASVADLVKTEKEAVAAFEGLVAAKTKEISALTASIESKTGRVGELGVEIATLKNDNEDTAENLEADKKFAADLKENCGKKAGTFEEEKKVRAEEVVAIADTIKILNDDDALELFKKTLPSASSSLLQVQESASSRRVQATQVLSLAQQRAESNHKPRLDFILLALKGKKAGFGKVITMVDNLVASLSTEQDDDDSKKEYCAAQFDKSEDTITGLKNKISDKQTEIADGKESLVKLVEEIAALKTAIVALDKQVSEATETRKAESAAHQELVTSNTAAKELLLFAKNRLNKFYNPKLYKAPPKRQLSEGDQIYVNQGGDIPTAAPGGIAGTGISAFVQLGERAAPPPPPATADAYVAKSQESGGVIAMIDLLVKDLDKEVQVSNVEEKNGKEEYEQTISDAAAKRRGDSKALTDKEAAKAELDSFLEEAAGDVKALQKENRGAAKYLSSLHGECDWLLKYYDARKQARADEIDSLNRAKAVLNGADYSFVQKSSTARARKFLRSA